MAGQPPRFDEAALRFAVAASFNWTETLRTLGYCPTGNNPKTVKKYVAKWGIDTSHFNPDLARHRGLRGEPIPLEEVLVVDSTYSRGNLKRRLYAEGLKQRLCEDCGQNEIWRGREMGLIIDHINGVRNDNRIENLRILCPNCAATLPTHCGRGLRKEREKLVCEGASAPSSGSARISDSARGNAVSEQVASVDWGSRPDMRKVVRPPFDQLRREIAETNYSAVGRRYGVTDKAIRKWVRAYEREEARNELEGR